MNGAVLFWIDRMQAAVYSSKSINPDNYDTERRFYMIIENSDDTLKSVANGDFSKFIGVKVDGALPAADILSREDYIGNRAGL